MTLFICSCLIVLKILELKNSKCKLILFPSPCSKNLLLLLDLHHALLHRPANDGLQDNLHLKHDTLMLLMMMMIVMMTSSSNTNK